MELSDKFETLTEKKVKSEHVVTGLFAIITIMLFSGFGASFVCLIAGTAYPLYSSIRSLEANEKAEKQFWLRYWSKSNQLCNF